MSDFKFSCPKCGQHIACDTSNAGMQIGCPGCQTTITVPTPPPAVPAAPGKLGINKTVSHAPAPSPAAVAHSAPVASRGPVAAAPKKKNPALIWGSVVGGLVLIGAVAYFGFVAPAQKKEQEAKAKQQQEEADRQAAEQKRLADEAAKPKAPKVVWNLDLSDVKIPDRPVSGKLNGKNFTAEKVSFQGGVLTLQQTNGFSSQFVISPLRPAETNAYKVTIDDTAGIPRVILNWKEEPPAKPGAASFTKGYAMKLEFDPPSPGKTSGRIFLSLPDDAQSFIAGTFEAGPKNFAVPAASPAGVKPTAAPRPRKKGAPPAP